MKALFSKKTKPTNSPEGSEADGNEPQAITRLRNLENRRVQALASRTARAEELKALARRTLDANVETDADSIAELAADQARLETLQKIQERAVENADEQAGELAREVEPDVGTMRRTLADLHRVAFEAALALAKKELGGFFDDGDLEAAARLSNRVRSELAFAASHESPVFPGIEIETTYRLPEPDEKIQDPVVVMNFKGERLVPVKTPVLRNAGRFLTAWDDLARKLSETEAHAAEIAKS